jgi:hypothetical protein
LRFLAAGALFSLSANAASDPDARGRSWGTGARPSPRRPTQMFVSFRHAHHFLPAGDVGRVRSPCPRLQAVRSECGWGSPSAAHGSKPANRNRLIALTMVGWSPRNRSRPWVRPSTIYLLWARRAGRPAISYSRAPCRSVRCMPSRLPFDGRHSAKWSGRFYGQERRRLEPKRARP